MTAVSEVTFESTSRYAQVNRDLRLHYHEAGDPAAETIARKHGAAHPVVLPTSSETGFGIPELRAEIVAVAQV